MSFIAISGNTLVTGGKTVMYRYLSYYYRAKTGKSELYAPFLAVVATAFFAVCTGKGLGIMLLGIGFYAIVGGMSAYRGEVVRNTVYDYDDLPQDGKDELDSINNNMMAANMMTITMIGILIMLVLNGYDTSFRLFLAAIALVAFGLATTIRSDAEKRLHSFTNAWFSPVDKS